MTWRTRPASDLPLQPAEFQALIDRDDREVVQQWFQQHTGSRLVAGVGHDETGAIVADILLTNEQGERYAVGEGDERRAAKRQVRITAEPPEPLTRALDWVEGRR